MATYLVTGGCGFIGSNIALRLVSLGHRVKVLDNLITGRKDNLILEDEYLGGGFPELVIGDIRDADLLEEVLEDVDYVLHNAAIPSVPRSVKDPIDTHSVNADGTLNLFWRSLKKSVKKVVIASSSSVYGGADRAGNSREMKPLREDAKPRPLSPYALQKLICEEYGRIFGEIYGLHVVSLRYFNVFGPRQDPSSQYAAVIPRFISALYCGDRPVIYGDGEQSRDFTFVENVVSANILACDARTHPGQVINVGAGSSCTVLELLDIIKKLMNKEIEPVFMPPRPGEIRHSLADISTARKVLGYSVKIGLEEGLRITINWFMDKFRKGEIHPFRYEYEDSGAVTKSPEEDAK